MFGTTANISHRTCTKASTWVYKFISDELFFFLNIAYGTNLSCSTVDLTCKCIGVNEHMIKINGVLFQHC